MIRHPKPHHGARHMAKRSKNYLVTEASQNAFEDSPANRARLQLANERLLRLILADPARPPSPEQDKTA